MKKRRNISQNLAKNPLKTLQNLPYETAYESIPTCTSSANLL